MAEFGSELSASDCNWVVKRGREREIVYRIVYGDLQNGVKNNNNNNKNCQNKQLVNFRSKYWTIRYDRIRTLIKMVLFINFTGESQHFVNPIN